MLFAIDFLYMEKHWNTGAKTQQNNKSLYKLLHKSKNIQDALRGENYKIQLLHKVNMFPQKGKIWTLHLCLLCVNQFICDLISFWTHVYFSKCWAFKINVYPVWFYNYMVMYTKFYLLITILSVKSF